MATVGGYSRHKMLAELNEPLFTNKGDGFVPLVYDPSEQKDRVRGNIGLNLSGDVSFSPLSKVFPTSLAGTNQTLTTDIMRTHLILGTPTGASTYTTATGAQIDAAFPELRLGDFFDMIIVNLATTAANDITVAGGTGVTVVGEAVIEANEATQLLPSQGRFWARKTGAGTYDLIRVGS